MGDRRDKGVKAARLSWFAAACLISACLLLSGSGFARRSGAEDTGPVQGTKRGPVADDRITAILAPRHQAVLSADVSGQVVAIKKELGEPFGVGETLVQLDQAVYEVNKRTAEATVDSAQGHLDCVQRLVTGKTRMRHAQAVLAAANANLAAAQRLHDNDRGSQLDLENAKRDVTAAQTDCELADLTSTEELIIAKSEVVVATGKLDIARTQLAACRIAGPWAGRVKRVLVNEHEFVERGKPVIEVIDDRVLLAKFLLPSSAFRSMRVGQELTLSVNEVSASVSMKVSHIAAALDPASITFEVYAELDNSDGKLRTGMNGSVHLPELKER